jgi:2-polyprenyl-3-methyl-5-hydroxy-6-metoxy-1,4-benzoquinol methylase
MTDQTSSGYLSPWLKAQRLKKIAAFVRGHVLDYGCGTGDLLTYCQPDSYAGYDLDIDSVKSARKKYPKHDFTFDFAFIQKMEKKFDVIVMAAVIEHVESPFEVLLRLKEFLAPKGRFILTTPHPNWRRVHDFGSKLGFFSKEASNEHKSFLDKKEVFSLGKKLDLKVLRAESFLFGANQLFVLSKD